MGSDSTHRLYVSQLADAARLSAMRWLLLACACVALACGDDSSPETDAGTDAPMLDAGIDAPIADAGIDVPPPPPVAAEAPYTQYVNPFFATGGLGFGVGSGFPDRRRPSVSRDRARTPRSKAARPGSTTARATTTTTT